MGRSALIHLFSIFECDFRKINLDREMWVVNGKQSNRGGSQMKIIFGNIVILILFIILSACGGGSSSSSTTYTIGGTITGLSGTIVLQNNSANDYTATADGSFAFSAALADEATYSVTVSSSPSDQTCNVTNGSGTVSSANVTSIIVSCYDSSLFSVGGTVSGLSGTLVLQNNAGDDLSLTTNGSFTFTTALDDGTAYAVTIKTQPDTQTCYLSNISGTISSANITNVTVACYDSGSLDTSFSEDGVVRFDGDYTDVGYAITTDSSGNILVAGYIATDNENNRDMAVWRYTSDGTLDTSFGINGVATYNSGEKWDEAYSLVVDDSDGVYVCGMSNPDGGTSFTMTILHYDSDGDLDSSFDTDGVVLYADAGTEICRRIRIDDNGKIVANGIVGTQMTVWRYTSTGSVDSSFGIGGVAQYSGSSSFAEPSFVFDSGDYINITSQTDTSGMTLWRYGSSGSLDTNFVNSVVSTYNAGTEEASYDIKLDSSENIFTAGYLKLTGETLYGMAVWKYTTGGDLDTSFGSNGVARYTSGSNQNLAKALVIDSSDQLFTAGYDLDGASPKDLYLWRYDTAGEIDTDFDSDGVVVFDGGAGDAAYDMVMDSQGRLLVTGYSSNGSTNDMVILRYYP